MQNITDTSVGGCHSYQLANERVFYQEVMMRTDVNMLLEEVPPAVFLVHVDEPFLLHFMSNEPQQ